MFDTHTVKPEIINLQITDIEYAQALAEGRNPLQEEVFERTLICAGIDPSDANTVQLSRTVENVLSRSKQTERKNQRFRQSRISLNP